MNERTRTSWDQLGETMEGLGLKLKLHAEQARAQEREKVDGAIESVRDAIESAFSTLHAAVTDPAVQADVKSVAAGLGKAVAVTLSDVRERMTRPDDHERGEP